jgi:hypothetical protein
VFRVLLASLLITTIVLVVVGLGRNGGPGPADARVVALHWVGTGVAQEPRADGDEWEVDVVRPDGSLVEVTIGHALEARGFDEERGAGGGLAHDEVRGSLRDRARRAALAATGPGHVLSVEREGVDEIEVGVRTSDGERLEVELNRGLGVVEVEPEDPRDE